MFFSVASCNSGPVAVALNQCVFLVPNAACPMFTRKLVSCKPLSTNLKLPLRIPMFHKDIVSVSTPRLCNWIAFYTAETGCYWVVGMPRVNWERGGNRNEKSTKTAWIEIPAFWRNLHKSYNHINTPSRVNKAIRSGVTSPRNLCRYLIICCSIVRNDSLLPTWITSGIFP